MVAARNDDERTMTDAGWRCETTQRKQSSYWNDPRWDQKWTGVIQPWNKTENIRRKGAGQAIWHSMCASEEETPDREGSKTARY